MAKFQVGQRVLVNYYDIVNEPATVMDEADNTYWCVFDRGRKTERASHVGVPYKERLLDPQWMNEDELQPLQVSE
jgi:hypothetical protein